MIINSPDPTYTVTEYDFSFSSNHFIQMTVDHRTDTITFGDKQIVIEFGEKTKGSRVMPAEKVTILYNHLVTYTERTKTLVEQSKEEVEDWNNFLHSKSIN